jgi:hypothetical protein
MQAVHLADLPFLQVAPTHGLPPFDTIHHELRYSGMCMCMVCDLCVQAHVACNYTFP